MVTPRVGTEAGTTPAAIVAAATRLFAAHGFDGTSVQAIADEVGVSKQAVLHHFASKDAVRGAVLEGVLQHWRDAVPRLLLAATGSGDRFEAVFGELYRFFAEEPTRARVLVREAFDRPAETRKLLRAQVRPWLEAVATYIRAGRDAGVHHPDVDAEAYVVHVVQLVIVATASQAVTGQLLEEPARDRYARELARLARAALFQPAAPAAKPARAPRKPTR